MSINCKLKTLILSPIAGNTSNETVATVSVGNTSNDTVSDNEHEARGVNAAVGVNSPSFQVSMKNVKLPKLTIFKFSGSPSEFQGFRDSSDAAINSNNNLSDIDKMNYLRGLLEGPAAAAISGLTLSNANYSTAVNIMKERFGIVISSHMDAMIKLLKVSSAQDIDKVRAAYDQIEIHVRGLNALGVNSEMFGSMLIPIIMEKLPDDFKLVVSRQIKEDTWNITDVLDAVAHNYLFSGA